MNWLLRISQNIAKSLIDEYYTLYRQIYQQQRQLDDQLRKQQQQAQTYTD